MKQTFVYILISFALITSMRATAEAQQKPGVSPPQAQQRPRAGVAQQPLRDANKAAKQAEQESRKLAADQPKRNEQQKIRTADAVVARYLGGVQNHVGLTDEQTQKLSVVLGRYVRQQLMLAERRNELRKALTEMTARQAPEEQIQAQYDQMRQTERQLVNRENQFYDGINPQLTSLQRANLKLYMDQTEQNIRQAIQKSNQ